MPLFEVGPDGLVPLQRLDQAVGDFDRQIEDALWRDPDPVYGSRLLRIQQRPTLSGGGHPTMIAVDSDGRLVIIHARQRVDRNELAECLEYFGWARAASLEELASLYWRGEAVFRNDWKRFADDEGITKLAPDPKLVLVAGELADRTTATFQLLVENGLPLSVSTLGVWRSSVGTLLLDIGDQAHGFSRTHSRSESDAGPADTTVDAPVGEQPTAVVPVTAPVTPGPLSSPSVLTPSASGGVSPTGAPLAAAPGPRPPAPSPVPSPSATSPAGPLDLPTPPPAVPAQTGPDQASDELGRTPSAPAARGGRASRRNGAEPVSPARGLTVVSGDGAPRADETGQDDAPARSAGPVSPAAGLSVVSGEGDRGRPEPVRPEDLPRSPESGRPEPGRQELGRPEPVRCGRTADHVGASTDGTNA